MGTPSARSPEDRAARDAELNAWLAAQGGRIVPAGDATAAKAMQTRVRGSTPPRQLSDPDSGVLAAAVRENVSLLSRDEQIINAGPIVGHPVEEYWQLERAGPYLYVQLIPGRPEVPRVLERGAS